MVDDCQSKVKPHIIKYLISSSYPPAPWVDDRPIRQPLYSGRPVRWPDV